MVTSLPTLTSRNPRSHSRLLGIGSGLGCQKACSIATMGRDLAWQGVFKLLRGERITLRRRRIRNTAQTSPPPRRSPSKLPFPLALRLITRRPGLASLRAEVVEIAGMADHLLDECEFKESYVSCDVTGLAIRSDDYPKFQQSEKYKPAPNDCFYCPLCYEAVPDSDEAWKKHVTIKCTANTRLS